MDEAYTNMGVRRTEGKIGAHGVWHIYTLSLFQSYYVHESRQWPNLTCFYFRSLTVSLLRF